MPELSATWFLCGNGDLLLLERVTVFCQRSKKENEKKAFDKIRCKAKLNMLGHKSLLNKTCNQCCDYE
jgi:hypothetical protein